MRIDQGFEREEAVVRDAGDPDLAVVARKVLHQPVDGVPGIGGVVDLARVERTARRQGHHVVALGPMDAAHVLIDARVAVAHQALVVDTQRHRDVGAGGASGLRVGVVGRARDHDRHRAVVLLGHDHHRVEPHAVAHRDHRGAPLVVPALGGRLEAGGDVAPGARQIGELRRRGVGRRRGRGGGAASGRRLGPGTRRRLLTARGGQRAERRSRSRRRWREGALE